LQHKGRLDLSPPVPDTARSGDGKFRRGRPKGAKSLLAEKRVAMTAEVDTTAVPILLQQDPGSAGVAVVDRYRRQVLPGCCPRVATHRQR
jgi:hypothetical protein